MALSTCSRPPRQEEGLQGCELDVVCGEVPTLIDVAWDLLAALQLINQLEDTFIINTVMAEHHLSIDARMGPPQT